MAKKFQEALGTVVVLLAFFYQGNTQKPESPCPRLFAYETVPNPEPNTWYGIVTLLSEVELNGVWLRLMFDRPILKLDTAFGKVEPRGGNVDFLVQNRDVFIQAHTPQTVSFSVKYDPNGPVPQFKGFRLNARTLCPEGHEDESDPPTFQLQTSNKVDTNNKHAVSSSETHANHNIGDENQVTNQQSESPCPRLFSYETNQPDPDRWYGVLTLLSDFDLNGVWLRVLLDRPAIELGNWFGEVEPKEGYADFLVKNRTAVLKANTPVTLRFYVKYDPKNSPPRLTGFRLNARVLCPEGLSEEATTAKLHLSN